MKVINMKYDFKRPLFVIVTYFTIGAIIKYACDFPIIGFLHGEAIPTAIAIYVGDLIAQEMTK